MKETTVELDLYTLYDRAYEDCIAHLILNVPDNYKITCPKQEEITLKEIIIPGDTRDYLEGIYHTDIAKLIETIKHDMKATDIYEVFCEEFGPLGQKQFDERYVDHIRKWEKIG